MSSVRAAPTRLDCRAVREWRRSAPAGRNLGPMGTVYAVANQKGGVGKTTTAVNLAACVAAGGAQTLLVDLDPQCNATVALGGDRDAAPVLLRLPDRRGLGRRGGAARRARQPLARAGQPRPRRRRGRAAADRGLRDAPARAARPGPRALRVHPARLPAVAGPGQRQRAGRRRPGDRPGAGRVPGARGPGPVPRHPGADPARAQPAPGAVGSADHHARRAHPPRPGRRARAARPLPRDGLRDGDPAQRPSRRGAELRPARDRARPDLARLGRLPRASPRRWRSVAERPTRHGPRAGGDPARDRRRGRRSCASCRSS